MAAFYGGMKYSSLQTRYEGHVGNRNPILGIGHVAHDEAHFDVEGNAGRGGRGPKSLRSRQQHQMQQQRSGAGRNGGTRQLRQGSAQQQQLQQPQQPRQLYQQPQTEAAADGPTHNRRGSFANLSVPVSVDAWRAAAGTQSRGKLGHGVHAVSGASPAIPNPEHYQVARNVNFNLRKPQQGMLKVQYRTPADKYFGGSTVSDINKEYNIRAGTALHDNTEKRPQDRGLLRASQEFGKNPITGEGHVSWDEADRDLDGRHGAGSRGATGNRTSNHQNAPHMGRQHRNVITGEGLRAYLSKDHSSHRVEDGECESYAYYKDRVITGKELGQNYRATAQLQWTAREYTSNSLPKKWKWSQ